MTLPVQTLGTDSMENMVVMSDLKFSQQLTIGLYNIVSQKTVLFMGVITISVDKQQAPCPDIDHYTSTVITASSDRNNLS
jgi:hypothetical protein